MGDGRKAAEPVLVPHSYNVVLRKIKLGGFFEMFLGLCLTLPSSLWARTRPAWR